ncbi:hypothetical protein BVC71_05790 [Marivivens niveibacter]|uniref:Uncharacterized protein n=1 Tax=Marivivens niveibacter TaxID=1930667 RepID=A0A251WZN3_9RHOB|nr:hypothetical protein BVC71_05790 [Marivivens niveibacter]
MIYTIYIGAALAEIAGCYCIWLWMRLDRTVYWTIPGVALLIGFAILLTLIPNDVAGRAYAAYGGVYITASVAWMWLIEGQRPSVTDISGGLVCLLGATIILVGAARAS